MRNVRPYYNTNGIFFNDERDARVNTCSVTIDVRGKMKKCSTSGMLSLNALDTNCLLRYNIHINSGAVDNDPVQRLFGFERDRLLVYPPEEYKKQC